MKSWWLLGRLELNGLFCFCTCTCNWFVFAICINISKRVGYTIHETELGLWLLGMVGIELVVLFVYLCA